VVTIPVREVAVELAATAAQVEIASAAATARQAPMHLSIIQCSREQRMYPPRWTGVSLSRDSERAGDERQTPALDEFRVRRLMIGRRSLSPHEGGVAGTRPPRVVDGDTYLSAVDWSEALVELRPIACRDRGSVSCRCGL
jgi:hypothetical protein